MAKKLKKKRKLKLIPALLFLIVIAGIYFGVSQYLASDIQNIVIRNNTYLKEQTILELAGLEDYPSFYFTTSHSIERRLKASPYLKDVKVSKEFFHKVVITVDEYRILYRDETDHKLVLEDGTRVDDDYGVMGIPDLINYVPDDKIEDFIKGMNKIEVEVSSKISEIQYVPNEFDKDRFLLFMDDGNSVYLTLTKFDMINYYNEVLPQLEGKKGILYLDSGNHFKIME